MAALGATDEETMTKPTSPTQLDDQVLVSRQDSKRLLGNVSTATLARLEKLGILKPIRLNSLAPRGQVFYARDNILSAAQGKRLPRERIAMRRPTKVAATEP